MKKSKCILFLYNWCSFLELLCNGFFFSLWNAVAMWGNSNPLLPTYCTRGKCWNQFIMHCDNTAQHECWRCHSPCSPIACVCVCFSAKKITSHTVCAAMGKGFGLLIFHTQTSSTPPVMELYVMCLCCWKERHNQESQKKGCKKGWASMWLIIHYCAPHHAGVSKYVRQLVRISEP